MSSATPEVHTEVDGHLLMLTNLDKVLYPSGFTKAEVIHHYLQVAEVMLPHLRDRCLTRMRFPDGTEQPGFYEKNLPLGAPNWVSTAQVLASDSTINYVVADSSAALVWLANLAAVELHTPQWHLHDLGAEPIAVDDVDRMRSSTIVVDLDPGEGITMVELSQAAMIIATALADDGLIPFVKTSGSKGLQVYAPIQPAPSQRCVDYVKSVGQLVTSRHGDRFVMSMNKQQRRNRIYIDYLQNMASRNTIAAYSLRARDTPTVSTPVSWDEVASVSTPDALRFTSEMVLQRISEQGDLWAELLDGSVSRSLPQSVNP